MKKSRIVFSSQQVKESFLKRVREGVNGVYGVGISPAVAEGIDNELTDKEKKQSSVINNNVVRDFLTSQRFVKALIKSGKETVFLIVKNGDEITFILNNHIDTIIKGDRFLKRTIPGLFLDNNIFLDEDLKNPPRQKRIRFLVEEHHSYPIKIVLEDCKTNPESFIREEAL